MHMGISMKENSKRIYFMALVCIFGTRLLMKTIMLLWEEGNP